jgi:hypothetical protein
MNIITLAFDMAKAVEFFMQKAKRFFYSVMLLGYRCPKCKGLLKMATEGVCQCNRCGYELNPTVEFQRCSACGGTPVLSARRYKCNKCGSDITSKFLFDGLVFDAGYFREKMTESRQRKKEKREQVRMMLAESRSPALPLGVMDFSTVPGLEDALNSLTADLASSFEIESRTEFNLKSYEEHIQAHIQNIPVSLGEIPPLSKDNARKDLIWRFIAAIFLAHYGFVDLLQDGQEILVMKHETNREGQDVFGESEEADGIEGSMGTTGALAPITTPATLA